MRLPPSSLREPSVSSSSPEPTTPPRSGRRYVGLVVRGVLTIGAVGWLATRVDLPDVWSRLQNVPPVVLATPFMALLGTAALHATRLTLLLRACDVKLAWSRVFSIMLRAAFVGAVSPRGGADIARVAWLSREAGRVEPVLASAFVGRILDIVPWLLMLLWGLSSGALSPHPALTASATAFSTLFAGVLVGTILIGAFGEPLAQRLPVFRDKAILVARAAHTLGRSPGVLARVAMLGVAVGALNVLSVFVVATALGADLPLLDAIGVVPAMDTVISLPVTISGVGLREGVFVLAFEPRGLDQDAAVAAAWTRWSGEIGRALVGGALFAVGGSLRSTLHGSPNPPPSTARSPETDE
jgi:uncharacterized membrane protein YbhN (UPF0104 family)